MNRLNTFFGPSLLLALVACGGENPDLFPEEPDGGELGTAEQSQYSLVYKPGSGNRQVIGNQGHLEPIPMGPPRQNSGCSTAQLGGTLCMFTRSDPLFEQEEGNWYGIRFGSNWHQGIITDATNALNDVKNGMQAASEVEAGGTEINLVNFYNPPGDGEEIVLENVDSGFAMPPTPNRAMQLYVRAAFSQLTPTLTEGCFGCGDQWQLPGTWKAASRCTINIDVPDLLNYGSQAVVNAGEGTPGTYSLLRQAMGYGINMCIGLGRKNHTVATNNTPYTHGLLTRNVFNGSKFFSTDELCLIWKSNVKSDSNTPNQLILWAGATCP